MTSVTRRKFVYSTAYVAYAALLPSCMQQPKPQNEQVDQGLSSKDNIQDVMPSDVSRSCDITTDDIEGPYYRNNAPNRSDIRPQNSQGEDLVIKGIVYSDDCVTPIENALVEIWQADPSGTYDQISSGYDYRGTQTTPTDGGYSFTTLVPGKYLNGSKYRPAHIHIKITAQNHKELITQIYFKGDVEIPGDPWASQDDADMRILPFLDEGLMDFKIALEKV